MKKDSISYWNIHSSLKDKKIKKANLEKFISRLEIEQSRGKWFSDYTDCPINLPKRFFEYRAKYIKRLKSEKSILGHLIKGHRADIDIARETDENFWKYDVNYQIDDAPARCGSSYVSTLDKNGVVYAIKNDHVPKILKIGYTTRKINSRLVEIQGGAGVIPGYYYSLIIRCSNPSRLESMIHRRFRDARLSNKKEFFKIDEETVIDFVEKIKDLDIELSYIDKK